MRLGLDSQTIFGLSPLEQIAMAAANGCGHVSLGLGPVPWKIEEIEDWSLRDDTSLRQDAVHAARDSGVRLALGEGFVIRSATDVRDYASDMDIMAELGVEAISTCGLDGRFDSFVEQFCVLCEMANERGLRTLLEFAPPHAVPGLQEAFEAIGMTSYQGVGLLIDAMHFFRCGNSIKDLTPEIVERVGRIQLCDAPFADVGKAYLEEACFERMAPGEGELPLVDLIAAIPASVPIGLEVPNRAASPDKAGLQRWVGHVVSRSADLIGR